MTVSDRLFTLLNAYATDGLSERLLSAPKVKKNGMSTLPGLAMLQANLTSVSSTTSASVLVFCKRFIQVIVIATADRQQ